MSRQFHVTVPHSLDRADALRRVKLLMTETQVLLPGLQGGDDQAADRCHFELKAMAFTVAGTITVNDRTAVIEGKLPFGMGHYGPKVEAMVAERFGTLLNPTGPARPEPPSGPTLDPPFRIV